MLLSRKTVQQQRVGKKCHSAKSRELVEVIQYLESGVLPSEKKEAQELALTKSQYLMQDSVLYRVEKDRTL